MTLFRDTFGIDYPDIIKAYLDVYNVQTEDYDRGYIRYKNKDYILHCDQTVRKTLGLYGEAKCMVSFQERKTGFYAMARLYREG
jgi:hypothetical protein